MNMSVKFPEFEYSPVPCPTCGLMHLERACKVPVLRGLFVCPLTERDDNFLRWMATWDVLALETFAALVQRAAAEENARTVAGVEKLHRKALADAARSQRANDEDEQGKFEAEADGYSNVLDCLRDGRWP